MKACKNKYSRLLIVCLNKKLEPYPSKAAPSLKPYTSMEVHARRLRSSVACKAIKPMPAGITTTPLKRSSPWQSSPYAQG